MGIMKAEFAHDDTRRPATATIPGLRRSLAAAATLAVLATGGCTERATLDAAARPRDVSRFLVGDAATRLDPSGTLVMPAEPPTRSSRPTVSRAHAQQLAAVYARQFGPLIRSTIERDHRGPIDFAHLALCGRVFYADAPVEELPDNVSDPVRRAYGSWWLVSLCGASNLPTVSVAVSVHATALQIVDGRLVFPFSQGGEFLMLGIPRQLGALPVSPEDAVAAVATTSSALVTAVPVLEAPLPSDGMPQMARWHVVLNHPSTLRAVNGSTVHRRADYFFGRTYFADSATTQAPVPNQPQTVTVRWRPVPPEGSRHSAQSPAELSVEVGMKPGRSVVFERVTAGGGK
jgi:hypothetical protein